MINACETQTRCHLCGEPFDLGHSRSPVNPSVAVACLMEAENPAGEKRVQVEPKGRWIAKENAA